METEESEITTVKNRQGEALKPLPFTYQKTDNPEEAKYKEWRISPVVFEGQKNEPRSDEEIVQSVRKQHEERQWHTSEYWRRNGYRQNN